MNVTTTLRTRRVPFIIIVATISADNLYLFINIVKASASKQIWGNWLQCLNSEFPHQWDHAWTINVFIKEYADEGKNLGAIIIRNLQKPPVLNSSTLRAWHETTCIWVAAGRSLRWVHHEGVKCGQLITSHRARINRGIPHTQYWNALVVLCWQ